MLNEIPTGTHCFIDANILYYHFVETPLLSDRCSDFLKRLERGDLAGSTTTAVIAEATHKVMTADAVQTHNLDRKSLVARLKHQPNLLANLHQHEVVAPAVRALNLNVEPVTLDLLEAASHLSSRFLLLTNDALTLAAMKEAGLTHLATNDDDFDKVDGIIVWKPR